MASSGTPALVVFKGKIIWVNQTSSEPFNYLFEIIFVRFSKDEALPSWV